jgi:glycosyltransferase involved in cell wall biosynthesis
MLAVDEVRVSRSSAIDPRSRQHPDIAPSPLGAEQTIAVVIPCYNEALTVYKVIAAFRAALPSAEIYVFDNNSTDATAAIAADAGATVIASPRQGKGNVLRHMADVVDADVYVVVDGDDTYPAEALPDMLATFNAKNLDMLVGARLVDFEQGSFRAFHQLGNLTISYLVSFLYRAKLTDVLSGYRILSRRCVSLVHLRHGGFEVETEYTLQALSKNLAIDETPVAYRRRPDGSDSKLNTYSDGFLILRCIVLLFKDYKPLFFFSAIAALLGLACIAVGSAPIIDYIEHRYVLHVPRAILAAGLAVLAAVSMTAGIILDTIANFHREVIDLWSRDVGKRH